MIYVLFACPPMECSIVKYMPELCHAIINYCIMVLSHSLYVSKTTLIKLNQPSFFLNDLKIPMVENCKYLGITIYSKNSDLDLKRQMRNIYANANLLLKKI